MRRLKGSDPQFHTHGYHYQLVSREKTNTSQFQFHWEYLTPQASSFKHNSVWIKVGRGNVRENVCYTINDLELHKTYSFEFLRKTIGTQ